LISTLTARPRPRVTDRRTSPSATERAHALSGYSYHMRAHQLRSSSPRRQRTRSQLGHAFTAATLPAASSLSSRHGAPQPPTAEETASVRYGRAQRYDGTRRRVPRPAALSTAREAQSMCSITGGKQPRESSSLIMRAPPRVQRLALAPHHDGATAESRDAERGSPFPRPSGWTAARVRRRKCDVKR